MKRKLLASLVLVALAKGASLAAGPVDRPDVTRDAQVVSVTGEGWVRFLAQEQWLEAFREQVLTAGDFLRTGDYGKMGILFADGIQIKVSKRTTLVIKEVDRPAEKKATVLGLEKGEVWSRAKTVPEGLRIETPSATAAIRGTDWDLSVDENGTSTVTVLAGSVSFYNDFGGLTVEPGQQAVAEIGKPPVRTFLVRPRERVQWVFSYPMDMVELVPFRSHRRQEALAALPGARERAEQDPSDLAAKLSLAGLLFDLKEKGESLELFDEVLAAEPGNPKALAFRGLLALDRGELEKAEALFERAAAGPGQDAAARVEALLGKAGVRIRQDEIRQAADLIGKLQKTEPANPVVGVVASVFEAYLGHFTGAVDLADRYAAMHPSDERFPILAASFWVVLDEFGKARESVARGLLLNPASSQGHAVLAGIDHLEGKGPEAEAGYRRAVELDPTNAGARNGLGLVRMEKGYFEEARQQVSEALEIKPDNPMLWANRGVLFTLIEKLERAREDYGTALEKDPTHYMTLNGLGLVALKEGRTEEAIEYFLKSSLIEPRFAQPHSFLAVAYYQLGNMQKAMDELTLAEQLDPRDPLPHLIAYLIHQDTYRPFDAVQEARKVLDLLPYMKSVEEIENTKAGLSNLGSALLSFGLADWSESYAQESYNPYNASSHFQASRRYNDNHFVAVSELIQGLLLDPLANSAPTRYQDIIRRPRFDLTLAGTWGDEDGGFSQQYSGIAQGYFREPFETSYSLAVQGYDQEGAVENGASDGGSLAFGLGVKPDYRNGFNFGFTASKDESGQPGLASEPDPDDELKTDNLSADLGYRHRFGPKNDLLARVAYDRWHFDLENPSPFGTGLTDFQLSFLFAGWDLATTRGFFRQGVYDVTEVVGQPPDATLVTDSTGTVGATPGVILLPSAFPAFLDSDPRRRDETTNEDLPVELRHLFNVGDRHEFTYGVEYIPIWTEYEVTFNEFRDTGTIDFYEEVILDPEAFGWTFPRVTRSERKDRTTNEGRFLTAYMDDRWKLSDAVLVEGSVAFESFSDDENDDNRFYPKIGIAVRPLKNHILRVGYQHWLEKVSAGTLAPVTTAGLVVDNSLGLQGSRIYDYQVRLESRWTGRLFTALGGERVELKDPDLGEGVPGRELASNRAMASINAILARQLALFLRYAYTDADGTGGFIDSLSIPGVPDHIANGGIVWISPLYVRVMASETYVGEQFADYTNEEKISDYWMTNLSAAWEPFDKHGFVGFAVNNLFNAGAPAPGRSIFLTLEFRL
ncbi:MAG: tetratricopeptide repeat protein [bacterium]